MQGGRVFPPRPVLGDSQEAIEAATVGRSEDRQGRKGMCDSILSVHWWVSVALRGTTSVVGFWLFKCNIPQ